MNWSFDRRRFCYQLPGKPGDLHLIPTSGGADSTFLVLLMTWLFPDVDFLLLFTDTGVDSPELYSALDRLEKFVERPITRIGDKTLYELIQEFNGYMPSAASRYCTRILKLEPMEAFLRHYREAGQHVHSYVGIRADEDRSGLVSHEDWITTHLPLKDMGIVRADVFRGLAETVTVPSFYKTRSRSGCGCCPFQRRSEVVGFLQQTPQAFAEAQAFEKLSETDQNRYADNAIPAWKETGLALNWLGLPVPARIDVRTCDKSSPVVWGRSRRGGNVIDLFDAEPYVNLWVGAEFFVDPRVGGSGVWQQRIVSWSTKRNGIEKQLQALWQHGLETPEVFYLDADEMRDTLKLAVYLIQVPAALLDVRAPSDGSYTWQSGQSFSQVRHLLAWSTRVLHVANLERELEENRDAPLMSVRYEWFEAGEKALSRVTAERGRLLGMDRFVPNEVVRVNDEDDERMVRCFACSI